MIKYIINLAIVVVLMNYSIIKSHLLAVGSKNNYQQNTKYGHGQSSGFIQAMYGDSSDLTAEEQQILNHAKYQSNNNKYFFKVGLDTGSGSLTNIKNNSTQINFSNMVLNKNKYKNSKQNNIELAVGYKLKQFSGDLEFLFGKTFNYDIFPLFNNSSARLNGVVKSRLLLLNGYYDLINFRFVNIFVGAGFGLGLHSMNFQFNNITGLPTYQPTKKSFSAAYNLLIGCKFQIISQFLAQISLRYTSFTGFGNIKKISTGRLIWQDNDKDLILKADRKFLGISFNLIHIFL